MRCVLWWHRHGGGAFCALPSPSAARALQHVDIAEALDFAARQIDQPAVKAVRNGSIRLMRCSWLISHCAAEGMEVGLPRCQELPEEAFSPPRPQGGGSDARRRK